ncbi:MAG TPA: hypothetical protein VNK46_02895 [Nitrospiraceae bacterium]|jgi:hypothetical protein|nr:hypothetical protein [Nitrospiraceae bacterium]
MADQLSAALTMLERQLTELEGIAKQTAEDLNAVAGKERIVKWKGKTVPLIAQYLGQKDAQQFAAKQPGPSFTYDLLEEFNDEVEFYRNVLLTLVKDVKSKARPGGGA